MEPGRKKESWLRVLRSRISPGWERRRGGGEVVGGVMGGGEMG